MSLFGALNIGSTALAVTQAQIQTTGNNIANAGNADYSRQTAHTTANKDQEIQQGIFVGTGVNLTDVQRQVDDALQSRLNGSTSDDSSASTTVDWLSRVESTFNELSDQDLSTQYSTFFNSWSDLANKPQDMGLRQVVVQNGENLAAATQDLRNQLSTLDQNVADQQKSLANNANNLAQQIADLNGQIVQAEGGAGGTANGLRDQRDAVVTKLSQLINVQTVQQSNGTVDVYVGSQPLVAGTLNRGISFEQRTVNGKLQTSIISTATNGALTISSGQLGALASVRTSIDGVIDQVDSLAKNTMFELNKLHSAGQGLQGLTTTTSTNGVSDSTAALNSAAAALPYQANTGSFVVHVTNKSTGLSTSTLVQVDLDGQNNNDTSLNSLAASLNGIAGISANVSGGSIAIKSQSADETFSFSQDSSNALAALGINSFFTGKNAADMAVNDAVVKDPSLLAAAQNGEPADNQTALAIAGLQTVAVAGLNGQSLTDSYQAMINGVATSAAAAKTNAAAATTVKQTLQSQRDALSGVSLDEEAVNLMQQQRAFQGAAKLITTVNDLMQTLINM